MKHGPIPLQLGFVAKDSQLVNLIRDNANMARWLFNIRRMWAGRRLFVCYRVHGVEGCLWGRGTTGLGLQNRMRDEEAERCDQMLVSSTSLTWLL